MQTSPRIAPGPRRATFVEGDPGNPEAAESSGAPAQWGSALLRRLRSLSYRSWVALSAVIFLCIILGISISAIAVRGDASSVASVDTSAVAPPDDADSLTNEGHAPPAVSPAPAESAASAAPVTTEPRYFRAGWSEDVHIVDENGVATPVSAAEWQAAGSPAVEIAPTRYLMTPWSSTIYGFVSWPAAASSDTGTGSFVVVPLTADQYVSAGSPQTEQVTRIDGDSFVQFTAGSSIYHVVGGELTPLTGAEWNALGSPAPTVQEPSSPAYIRGILLVNKSFPLPADFGDGLTDETVEAFEAMREAASSAGLSLRVVSGFRSYASQEALYSRYVRSQGQAEADRFSARPGHSEHQTGLTVDINQTSAGFANTDEGRWVAENAHQFGFIVRYPDGKEDITGYTFEPWHVRYVGVEVATYLKDTGLTLDEYLGVSSAY